MDERDLRAIAETYGKIVTSRDRLRAQRRPHAVLTALAETVRYAGMLSNVLRTFRDEVRFEYAEDGRSADLHWLNTSLRLVLHEEPHWIFPEDYDLDLLFHDFACTRLVAWTREGESDRVAGEVLFFDNGEVRLTGCFGEQHVDVLTEYNQVADELFEWMLKEFRPREERTYKRIR
jgi:PAS domain-containing protein